MDGCGVELFGLAALFAHGLARAARAFGMLRLGATFLTRLSVFLAGMSAYNESTSATASPMQHDDDPYHAQIYAARLTPHRSLSQRNFRLLLALFSGAAY